MFSLDPHTVFDWIVALFSCGAIGSVYYAKQTKEGKKIDNATQLVEQYKDLLDRSEREKKELKDVINALTDKVTLLEKQVAVMQPQLTTCQFLYKQAIATRCENLNCKKRRPPLDRGQLESLGAIEINENDHHEDYCRAAMADNADE